MDIEALFFAGFVLYIFFSIFSPSKKDKKAKQARQKRARRGPRKLPQNSGNQTARPKSLESVLQEMYREQTGRDMPKKINVPKESEVFSYDNEYESYDEDYEGKAYDERKKQEIEVILETRKRGEHLGSTLNDKIKANKKKEKLEAQRKKNKKLMGSDFKFNAKEAIIYDVIMNRKYK